MQNFNKTGILLIALFVAAGCAIYFFYPEKEEPISYNRDVKPILNKNCMACHGGVKKQGGVSFLFEELAKSKGESGEIAVVPHKPEESELVRRITHDNPEERMPPESDPLSKEDIDILTKWVDQGAKWDLHWAYEAPKPISPPQEILEANTSNGEDSFLRNEIDHFILKKMKENGLTPNPEATGTELLRRVSLDLTGLPPKDQWVDKFIDDQGNIRNYEELVDTLLNSPAYGERWAGHWMDLARYGDSMGFQKDPYRSIWRYKEWLIEAFNNDKPFDEFTVEQIAGDLLPQANDEQIIATAFYRNSLNNSEGGTDDEEYRVAAVLERINTTWEVWMGTTMSCVQCHDHPYDPFTMDNYYSFMTFLNNSADRDTNDDAPNRLSYPVKDRESVLSITSALNSELNTDQFRYDLNSLVLKATYPYLKAAFADKYYKARVIGGNRAQVFSGGYVELYGPFNSEFIGIDFKTNSNGIISIWNEKGQIFEEEVDSGMKSIHFNEKFEAETLKIAFTSENSGNLALENIYFTKEKAPSEFIVLTDSLYSIRRIPTPVMRELKGDDRRDTYKFLRGNWMSHGEEMSPSVPEFLNKTDLNTTSRLDMAQWLVSEANPITARVIANRYWEQIMGKGLVKTLEDFGSQAPRRTHPELLDWLAHDLQHEKQWSLKEFFRTIVLSGTYRQSSVIPTEKLKKDPENKWYSRAERVRLPAEMIRDQALAVSGLLSNKMYGPGVMPPQPEGVWNVIRGLLKWETSPGEDKYRRALYTFWRKTSPYPSFITFDSPSKEFCTSRRNETNTPLQALVTLNDPVYFEAALHMAKQMAQYPAEGEAIEYAYKKALFKAPDEETLELLTDEYKKNYSFYRENKDLAMEIAGNEVADPARIASLTLSANVVMNLDEFLNRN